MHEGHWIPFGCKPQRNLWLVSHNSARTKKWEHPFGSNSLLSCDAKSNYFKQNLNGFINNRLYRIILRLQLDDGRYRIFDDNFNFKVVK